MSPDGGELRVWLDDDLVDRTAPEGWMQVTTAREAIELLLTGRVVELSLDHDLGDDEQFGRGVDVVDFIVIEQEVNRRDLWPRDGIGLREPHRARHDGSDHSSLRREGADSPSANLAGRPAEVHLQEVSNAQRLKCPSAGDRETKKQGDSQNAIALAIGNLLTWDGQEEDGLTAARRR